jgi:hypothetical protein
MMFDFILTLDISKGEKMDINERNKKSPSEKPKTLAGCGF